jgi:4-amino-4-deoxy-L-arabinose transferase-like glycosyltransferase
MRGRWETVAVTVIVLAAATAYCWDLDIQRWANAYYSAIAQSGAESWKAFFFGSLDPGNATSSDKPPGAFWLMALSVRTFGLNSWSLIVPQALETAATILVLNRAVRRLAGPVPALLAAVALAATPAVLALARYNHPDTLMTLLVVSAAYCCVRALDSERRAWLVATGVLLGLAFLSKWAVALLPAPSFAAALVTARRRAFRVHLRRLGLVAIAGTMTGLSWVAVVLAVPAAARPYADGSGGSLLSLVIGRDGFSRLGSGSLGPAPGNPVSGSPGVLRLFEPPFSGQVAWLLPLALSILATVAVRSRGRLSPGLVLFGGWLVTTVLAFSAMSGAMHPYYGVLMAPAVAAVVGLGMHELRGRRERGWVGMFAAGTVAYGIAVGMTYGVPRPVLWLAGGLAVASLSGAALVRAVRRRSSARSSLGSSPARLAAATMAAGLLLCPMALSLETIRHPMTGSDPLAGPASSPVPARYPADLMTFLGSHQGGSTWLAAVPRATAASLMQLQDNEPVLPLGGFTGHSGGPTLAQVRAWVDDDRLRYLVLTSSYVAYPDDTPPALHGFAIASVLSWAARTGCSHRVDPAYVVLDLDAETCTVGGAAATAQ